MMLSKNIESVMMKIDRQRNQIKNAMISRITDEALVTIKKARDLAISLPADSDMKKLVDSLILYLDKRKDEIHSFFLNDFFQIERRAKFVEGCVDAITKGDVDALEKHLATENIMQFKGFRSNKMYNLLTPYQSLFEKRQIAIFKNTILPKVIVDVIGEYDKSMHKVL